MFKCDYHTHSRFSFDGSPDATLDALCLAAIERGVTDLAITDHFECNWRDGSSYPPFDSKMSYNEYNTAKEKYKKRLNLTFGVEIGQANQFPNEAKAFIDRFAPDFVISSVHNLTGTIDFYYFDFAKINRNRQRDSYVRFLFERCIDEVCDSIDALPKIDTVGHLTYMQRYCEAAGLKYDFSDHEESLERLFKKMISKDIALEVNVSTLWRGMEFTMPNADILSLYRRLGGKLITVGTDSHSPEHIGECVEEAFNMLKRLDLCDIVVIRNGIKTVVKI